MAKKIILSLFIITFFISCAERNTKIIKEEYQDGNPKLVHFVRMHKGDTILKKELRYYKNGQKELSGEYFNNQKHGRWIYWYANGNKWSEGYFEKNLRVGKTMVHHENGQLHYKGAYDKGKKSGVWSFYSIEGEMVNKVTFENGMIKSQGKTKK